ncbi:MAG: adenosyl-hopene transferase HpnH [Planctomycetia bacterium]
MRFPLSLTRSMTGYLMKKRLAGAKRFPMVLMLEPLHACNLHCSGCGRIREYAEYVKDQLTVEQCLAAIDECGAPIISVCGGEPLIYRDLTRLLESILSQQKHIYLCTNGLQLAEKVDSLPRDKRLFINVHLDGMEATHDLITGRSGSFARAVEGLRAAKEAGYFVYTNTTLYRETDMNEVVVLFDYLSELNIDGFMLSPAYGYEAVYDESAESAEAIYLTKAEIHERFREARPLLEKYRLTTSPVYLDFLCGERELDCAAWANPTYNICGWKGPCYLSTDAHYPTYAELIEKTDWDALGHGRDPRCENCLVHCGFEPAAVFAANRRLRDICRMAVWQFS